MFLTDATRVAIQGIGSSLGRFFAARIATHSDKLVCGSSRTLQGSLGTTPVYPSLVEAARVHDFDCALSMAPATAAKAALADAIEAGVSTFVCYAENVPVHDAMAMKSLAGEFNVTLLGPNSAGVAVPGLVNVSDLDESLLHPGDVGVVSRSGTLAYEMLVALDAVDRGVSTLVCVGGDLISGVSIAEVVDWFSNDERTTAIAMIGEIGGTAEIEAARIWKASGAGKPLVAFVAGRAAPPQQRMGHSGAFIANADESANDKINKLEQLGVTCLRSLWHGGNDLSAALAGRGITNRVGSRNWA